MYCKIMVIGFLCLFVNQNALISQTDFELDALFSRWTTTDDMLPGLAVAIIKEDKVVYRNTHGYANLEYGIALETHSVFDMASLAKQFTGLAVARLIVDGQLDMEDSVQDHLPGLGPIFDAIKVKHLVYHTSGLRDIGELFGIGPYGGQLTSSITLQIMQRQEALNFDCGTESDYSNSNYVLLALIVEKVTGSTFRDWCSDHIFQPLGMNNTFVNDNPMELIQNRANAYYAHEGKIDFNQDNGMYLTGASAVYSTIDDMILWARAVQSEALFAEAFQLMKRRGSMDNGNSVDYGFGLGLGEVNGIEFVEHSGSTPAGFRSQITWVPSEQLAVVLLSNSGNINLGEDFGRPIIEHYSNNKKPIEELGMNEQEAIAVKLSNTTASLFVGNYLFNDQMKVDIINDEGALKVQPEGQPPLDLIPLNDSTLNFPAFRSTLHFSIATGYDNAEIYQRANKVGGLRRIKERDEETHPLSDFAGQYFSSEMGMLLEIMYRNQSLAIYSPKYGETELEEMALDLFRVGGGLDSSILIERDRKGNPLNILLTRGSRMRNVKFEKFRVTGS